MQNNTSIEELARIARRFKEERDELEKNLILLIEYDNGSTIGYLNALRIHLGIYTSLGKSVEQLISEANVARNTILKNYDKVIDIMNKKVAELTANAQAAKTDYESSTSSIGNIFPE